MSDRLMVQSLFYSLDRVFIRIDKLNIVRRKSGKIYENTDDFFYRLL